MADIYKSRFTGQEIDDILTRASNATNIEANPSGEATEELTKITIGGTTYSIPEGTVVEANPSGDATVELTKLKIGDMIYSISQGGGGGSKMYRHLVYVNVGIITIISDNNDVITTIRDLALRIMRNGGILNGSNLITSSLLAYNLFSPPDDEDIVKIFAISQSGGLTDAGITTIQSDEVTEV